MTTILQNLKICKFEDDEHRQEVIQLWKLVFGEATGHNNPAVMIDKKIEIHDDLFFVATLKDQLIGTVMAGYDGHRGWIYSLAVHPDLRNQNIGSQLLAHAEKCLNEKGCLKINLQIRDGNESVQNFYESNGYSVEKRISMGKLVR